MGRLAVTWIREEESEIALQGIGDLKKTSALGELKKTAHPRDISDDKRLCESGAPLKHHPDFGIRFILTGRDEARFLV